MTTVQVAELGPTVRYKALVGRPNQSTSASLRLILAQGLRSTFDLKFAHNTFVLLWRKKPCVVGVQGNGSWNLLTTNCHTEAQAVSTSSGVYLAAPAEHPSQSSHIRSPSNAPSRISTQSSVTIVSNHEEAAGLNSKRVHRQQTFKIRKLSFMDRLKGLFDSKSLHEKIERDIEAVEPHVLDERASYNNIATCAFTDNLDVRSWKVTLHCRCPRFPQSQ